jgi:hypothetical protein
MLWCDGSCANVQRDAEVKHMCMQYFSSDRHGDNYFRLFLKMLLLRTVLDTGSVSVCGARCILGHTEHYRMVMHV